MNDHVHPIFKKILNDFVKPSMQTMSPKEYYSLPYETLDDDSYGAWAHQQELDQQEQQEN